MKHGKPILILCLFICLLTGCRQQKPIPLKMVQWVHISGAAHDGGDNRYLYQPESLQKFLMAVRQSGQTIRPVQDPEMVDSPEFCITTVHADGTRHKMYVKGDRYIKSENGPWRQADPENLAPLHYLLHFQPGDAVE